MRVPYLPLPQATQTPPQPQPGPGASYLDMAAAILNPHGRLALEPNVQPTDWKPEESPTSQLNQAKIQEADWQAQGLDPPLPKEGQVAEGPRRTFNINSDMGGPSPTFGQRVIGSESGGNVRNPAGGASGWYQFTRSTWRANRGPEGAKYSDAILAPRWVQDQAFARLTQKNVDFLKQNKIPINDATLYMAHNGIGVVHALMHADNSDIAADVVGNAVAKGNPIFYYPRVGNKYDFNNPLTVAEAKQMYATRIGLSANGGQTQ